MVSRCSILSYLVVVEDNPVTPELWMCYATPSVYVFRSSSVWQFASLFIRIDSFWTELFRNIVLIFPWILWTVVAACQTVPSIATVYWRGIKHRATLYCGIYARSNRVFHSNAIALTDNNLYTDILSIHLYCLLMLFIDDFSFSSLNTNTVFWIIEITWFYISWRNVFKYIYHVFYLVMLSRGLRNMHWHIKARLYLIKSFYCMLTVTYLDRDRLSYSYRILILSILHIFITYYKYLMKIYLYTICYRNSTVTAGTLTNSIRFYSLELWIKNNCWLERNTRVLETESVSIVVLCHSRGENYKCIETLLIISKHFYSSDRYDDVLELRKCCFTTELLISVRLSLALK